MADVVFGHPHGRPPFPSVHRRLGPSRRMDMDVDDDDDDDDDGLGIMLANINLDNTTTDDDYDYSKKKKKKKRFHNPLSEKKLVLVLDLDRTLLHTTFLSQLSYDEKEAFLLDQTHNHDLFTWESGFEPLMTKLRPFVHNFLNKASHLFDMYIYTLGSRTYAEGIAKILDPQGLYFGGDSSKLISRDDTIRLVGGHRKTLTAVPRDERTVVIIDDKEEVWYGHQENLIHIQGYDYFDSSTCSSTEDEACGALATILDVLQDAHSQFFDPGSCNDISCRDVRLVLRSIRQKILQGCDIVFSWVLPSNYNDGQAERKPVWKMARELGATCSMNQEILLAGGSASVTHVVASNIGNKTAQWAVQNNKFLVTTLWIEAAYYSWHRPREDDFLLFMPS